MTRDERTTSEIAAGKLREVARYLDANAESLVGNLDNVFVVESGLRFSFTLLEHEHLPTITVTRECIVFERQ